MKEFLLSLGFTADGYNWYNFTTKDYNIEIALGVLPSIRVEIGNYSIYYTRVNDVTSIGEIKEHLLKATNCAKTQLDAMRSTVTALEQLNEKIK